ncbi:MAG: hypothetical protein AAGD10_17710 [Myxococcota bacterium]
MVPLFRTGRWLLTLGLTLSLCASCAQVQRTRRIRVLSNAPRGSEAQVSASRAEQSPRRRLPANFDVDYTEQRIAPALAFVAIGGSLSLAGGILIAVDSEQGQASDFIDSGNDAWGLILLGLGLPTLVVSAGVLAATAKKPAPAMGRVRVTVQTPDGREGSRWIDARRPGDWATGFERSHGAYLLSLDLPPEKSGVGTSTSSALPP